MLFVCTSGGSCGLREMHVRFAGSFGEAILCVDKRYNMKVIVKRMSKAGASPKEMKQAVNEVQILSRLNHVNIVKYIDSWLEKGVAASRPL